MLKQSNAAHFIKRNVLAFVLLLLCFGIYAQQNDDDHDHDHFAPGHSHGDHHKIEIGIANSPVYFFKEKELAYGLHLHVIRAISKTKFGIGIGYERIFDEHKHTTIGIVGSYRVFDELSINFSPGITFEGDSEKLFAAHFEATYEFELGNIHLGPVFEIAYDPEDIHLSLGLHIGYGF